MDVKFFLANNYFWSKAGKTHFGPKIKKRDFLKNNSKLFETCFERDLKLLSLHGEIPRDLVTFEAKDVSAKVYLRRHVPTIRSNSAIIWKITSW